MITITPLENLLAWVKQMDTTIAENKFVDKSLAPLIYRSFTLAGRSIT